MYRGHALRTLSFPLSVRARAFPLLSVLRGFRFRFRRKGYPSDPAHSLDSLPRLGLGLAPSKNRARPACTYVEREREIDR